jgi:putative heme-binding domain-containing protein
LALFSEAEIGKSLAQKYRRFQPEDRPAVLETLVSRPAFAEQLLNALALSNPPVPLSDLTAYHARQIRSLNDPGLSSRLADVWGQFRETPAARRQWIDQLKQQLTGPVLAQADLSSGKALYTKQCSQCHQLFGQGKKIGPDLSGSQRTNLDYVLENIVDPSAVVGKGYAMSRVLTSDGRVLGGLIISRNDKTLVIQTQTQLETLAADEVETVEATALSPMPDGMLENLSPEQVRDLVAYLMSPGGA